LKGEPSSLLSLRRALESAGQGAGMARSVVVALGRGGGVGAEAARRLLLGGSIPSAMEPLMAEGTEEVAMLASLVVAAPKSSAPVLGRSAGAVAKTLERWAKEKESRALERRVMRFRGVVTSGVLGAVTAMLATLGPLVGALGSVPGEAAAGGALVYGAAAMTAVSSGMLGALMSGRGFYVNVAVSLAAFLAVGAVASPLVGGTAAGAWGVI
jgi:hypothetical protein